MPALAITVVADEDREAPEPTDAILVDGYPPVGKVVNLDFPRNLVGFTEMYRNAQGARNLFSDSVRRKECLKFIENLVDQLKPYSDWEEAQKQQAA